MRSLLLSAAIAGLLGSTQIVLAQDLSDEEILERFVIQRDAYTAVKTGKGKTRGLTIVTVDDLEAEAAGGTDVAAVEGTTPGTDETRGEEIAVAEGGTAPTVSDDSPEMGGSTTDDGSVTLTEAEVDPVTGGDAPGVITAAAADAPIDPGQVGILPEELQVNVRISFDYDSALIKPEQMPVIEQMCRVILASDIQLFRIMGHTDTAGSDEYNDRLSLLRAEEVKRQLVGCGVAEARLEAMGLGERFLYDKQDPAGADNRRVEFQAMS